MDELAECYRRLAAHVHRRVVEQRDPVAVYCFGVARRLEQCRAEYGFSERTRCFVRRQPFRRLTGLKRIMSHMLHGNEDGAGAVERRGAGRGGTCGGGLEHGKRVHADMERLIDALAAEQPLDAEDEYDPCAVSALRACMAWRGWLPLMSEYAVGDPHVGVGTAIDLVAVDVRRMRIKLIELKTGGSTRRYHPAGATRFAQPPFDAMQATPCNQHAMQAVLGQAIVEQRHPDLLPGILEAEVLRVSGGEGRTYAHPVPDWGRTPEARRAIYALFGEAARRRRNFSGGAVYRAPAVAGRA